MILSRLDRSPVTQWWWTVDRWFLAAFLTLMGLGIVLSLAASPAVAERIGLDSFHFAYRQMFFMTLALATMLGVSFLDAGKVRRLALVLLALSLVMMVAVLFFGTEVKGARRWLSLAGVSVQPSEFLKPGFVVICAWLFATHNRRHEFPGNLLAIALVGLVTALLVLQPDLGQTLLAVTTWGIMFFMAGMSWLWIVLIGAAGAIGVAGAYLFVDHFASRIDRFITGEGDNFQVNVAYEAVVNGGWWGQGPGEGVSKRILPDSHADFVYAVAGEEFGILLCMAIMGLFAFIVLRGLMRALREHDDFTRYAVSGLVIVFGLQSIVNMGVNLRMLPAKGMTLPFLSYGGSSLIAIAISMGMVLALTRRRPERRKSAGMDGIGRLVPAE